MWVEMDTASLDLMCRHGSEQGARGVQRARSRGTWRRGVSHRMLAVTLRQDWIWHGFRLSLSCVLRVTEDFGVVVQWPKQRSRSSALPPPPLPPPPPPVSVLLFSFLPSLYSLLPSPPQ